MLRDPARDPLAGFHPHEPDVDWGGELASARSTQIARPRLEQVVAGTRRTPRSEQ